MPSNTTAQRSILMPMPTPRVYESIAPPRRGRHNYPVSAERIIAIEAALSDVSELYTVARHFTPLQARAESELLPHLAALGGRLRNLVRHGGLDDVSIGQVATEIMGLAAQWRAELEAVRELPVYRRAVEAWHSDCQDELAEVIPQIFAGLLVVEDAESVYFPVSPSTGRRRPGTSPFLSAPDCAEKIVRLLVDGVLPDTTGDEEWWEQDLPSIVCADTLAALETPIALRLAADDVHVTVFGEPDASALRIFAARIHAPMSVVLAREATDEWWMAYQDSYRAFRDALQLELAARGQTVIVLDAPADG